MSAQRVLVAGIGNIFLGDDAFGVEVARRLADRALPDGVRVVDFGIRGFDLAHALLDGDDATILVDATPRGGAPGSLYLIEPAPAELEADGVAAAIETHAMDPLRVLRLAWAMGARPRRVLVVGCEPSPLTEDEYELGCMGLSPPVQAAVDQAVELVESVLADLVPPATADKGA
jgi:hydrogenase maturation protease